MDGVHSGAAASGKRRGVDQPGAHVYRSHSPVDPSEDRLLGAIDGKRTLAEILPFVAAAGRRASSTGFLRAALAIRPGRVRRLARHLTYRERAFSRPIEMSVLQRLNHRRRDPRNRDVLGAVADLESRNFGAIRDRDDRQIVAPRVGNEAGAPALADLRPARRITNWDRGDQRQVRNTHERGVVGCAAGQAQRSPVVRNRKAMMRGFEVPVLER